MLKTRSRGYRESEIYIDCKDNQADTEVGKREVLSSLLRKSKKEMDQNAGLALQWAISPLK